MVMTFFTLSRRADTNVDFPVQLLPAIRIRVVFGILGTRESAGLSFQMPTPAKRAKIQSVYAIKFACYFASLRLCLIQASKSKRCFTGTPLHDCQCMTRTSFLKIHFYFLNTFTPGVNPTRAKPTSRVGYFSPSITHAGHILVPYLLKQYGRRKL